VARAGFLLLAVALSAASAQSIAHNFTQSAALSFTPSVVVYNFTALADAARPDFVVDVNGCSIYVYVVLDSPERQDPLLHTEIVATKMSASPMYSGEVLEAFLKALGPRVTAGVWILKPAGGYEERALEVEARGAAELREAVERALGIPLASNYTEALKTAAATKRPAAYLVYLVKREGDVMVSFDFSPVLQISSTNGREALEVLSRIREAAGGRTPPAFINIGPYWTSEAEVESLVRAAETLERELGTVKVLPDGVEGIVDVLVLGSPGNIGPYFIEFPYPNGSIPPDRATAERVVRRFIQLAGFCRSPMVAEFRPKTGFIKAFLRPDPTPALAAVVGVAAASAAAVSILKRRRRRINPP